MTYRISHLVALAAAAALAACADRPGATAPDEAAPPTGLEAAASAVAPGPRPERLARLFARALSNPAFRAYVKAQLDASPYRERKLQLQTFIAANGGRALRTLAREGGVSEADVEREGQTAISLEVYLPVPEHRAAWTGDERVLVATALSDREAPVAFDPAGRRRLLSPDRPPAIPVIAIVPVETRFSAALGAARISECSECFDDPGDGGGGGGGFDVQPPPPPPPGLYMSKSHLVRDFEGWLKGSPEIEVHILGQKGQTDTLVSYQCAGAESAAPYRFDQNGLDWSGSVMLFAKTQIDQYNAAHPGKNFRVFFIEDDDGACQIRTDRKRLDLLMQALDGEFGGRTAGNDSTTTEEKRFKAANTLLRILVGLASWIKTNDDPIGNAVEDLVAGVSYPGYNWIIKGESSATNGWIHVEMR